MKIKLIREKNRDKDGKPSKAPEDYKQHDAAVLAFRILPGWDSKKGKGMEDYKLCLNITDKAKEAWRDDKIKELDLSLNEASFLKDLLENFKDKCLQDVVVPEVVMRTIVSLVEQLDKK